MGSMNRQRLKWLSPTVLEMHLQESTFFLPLTFGAAKNAAHYPLHHVTYAHAKFYVATTKGLENAFIRNSYFDLGVNVTRNVAQYPLHYVNYAPVKFEVATPKG